MDIVQYMTEIDRLIDRKIDKMADGYRQIYYIIITYIFYLIT